MTDKEETTTEAPKLNRAARRGATKPRNKPGQDNYNAISGFGHGNQTTKSTSCLHKSRGRG